MTKCFRQQKRGEASRSCLRTPKHATDVSQSIAVVQPLYPGYCSFQSNKKQRCNKIKMPRCNNTLVIATLIAKCAVSVAAKHCRFDSLCNQIPSMQVESKA